MPYHYGIGAKVTRYLVYGLTDHDGAVRYVGRSCTGLLRPHEHVVRVSRERTHKAAWIRSLLRSGLMYGVRVLEECADEASTVAAEIRWIAEGRRLGWRLTNLTDGGEGSNVNRKTLPDAEIVQRYSAGESELALAQSYGVSRAVIGRRLREADVPKRGGSDANRLRMARLSPDERHALSAPAHAGRRRAAAQRRIDDLLDDED